MYCDDRHELNVCPGGVNDIWSPYRQPVSCMTVLISMLANHQTRLATKATKWGVRQTSADGHLNLLHGFVLA